MVELKAVGRGQKTVQLEGSAALSYPACGQATEDISLCFKCAFLITVTNKDSPPPPDGLHSFLILRFLFHFPFYLLWFSVSICIRIWYRKDVNALKFKRHSL